MLSKSSAICIRVSDYSETSQIASFFTRTSGKISTIAKGSKRPKSPFDGTIEMFSAGRIVFSANDENKLAILTEFEQQPQPKPLRNNLFALNCASFAVELINHLTKEYDPHPGLFDSFLEFLQNAGTDENKHNTLALLILFQLSLLKEIGLQPILNACTNCKTKYEQRATSDEFYFSSSANGLLCRDCEANFPDKIRLSKNAAGCLANLKLIAHANGKALGEIEKVLIYHFTCILGRQPKMAKHILSVNPSQK